MRSSEQTDKILKEAESLKQRLQTELEDSLRGKVSYMDKRKVTRDHLDALSGELKRVTAFYRRRQQEGAASPWAEVKKLLTSNIPKRALTPVYWQVLKKSLADRTWPDSNHGYSDEEVVLILAWTYRCLRSA